MRGLGFAAGDVESPGLLCGSAAAASVRAVRRRRIASRSCSSHLPASLLFCRSLVRGGSGPGRQAAAAGGLAAAGCSSSTGSGSSKRRRRHRASGGGGGGAAAHPRLCSLPAVPAAASRPPLGCQPRSRAVRLDGRQRGGLGGLAGLAVAGAFPLPCWASVLLLMCATWCPTWCCSPPESPRLPNTRRYLPRR